uniref:Protein phosphatase 1 regulatory subunit n=1 Tax=Mustela putorius furo TaxID=9669 RepID=M3Y930_MUSPF
AVLDSTNADGISALHQACIDENLEVVRFLVEQGATVNQADNEGWTPLHVAASCGYLDIARYLLSHGANIAAVNSDGDLPLDLAESDAMEGLLKAEIAFRGVDVEAAKRAEEELLLHDTRCWLNGGAMPEARHPRTGASALHVAAAKGYIEVMRLLLQAGYDPELRDGDGWTPLHAAAHWGVEDACRLLAEHGGGMDSLTHAGQRPCDLADEEVLSLLEELARKQEDVSLGHPLSLQLADICSSMTGMYITERECLVIARQMVRSSVCRLSSREKISLQDLSKERRPGGAGGPPIQDEDEGEEGLKSRALNGVSSPPPPGPQGPMVAASGADGSCGLCGPSGVTLEELGKDPLCNGDLSPPQPPEEAPFSRRFGLQKTGSSGTLGPTDRQGAEGTPGAALQRSASSSRLEGSSAQVSGAKEPRLARIMPTPSRKLPEPSAFLGPGLSGWEAGLGSTLVSMTLSKSLCSLRSLPAIALGLCFPPVHQVKLTVNLSRRAPAPGPWLCSSHRFEISRRPPSANHSPPSRISEPESPVKPSVPVASTAPPADSRDRRRSYQMPVRDEESESQRKARSRLMRQSRRSTQGVTLTDLKEAEKVAGKAPEPEKSCLQSLVRGVGKQAQGGGRWLWLLTSLILSSRTHLGDPESLGWRTLMALPREVRWSSCPLALPALLLQCFLGGRAKDPDPAGIPLAEEPDGQGQGPQATKEHRRVGKEWRGLAEAGWWARLPSWHQAELHLHPQGEEAEPADRSPDSRYRVGREGFGLSAGLSREGGPSPCRQRDPEPASEEPDGGFRKLYSELRSENERLREALTETTLRLAQLKVELERATQRQERFAERPALLELERFERRALERKAAELEEELKALSDLRADNQRLKDENAALIRVISKLSK